MLSHFDNKQNFKSNNRFKLSHQILSQSKEKENCNIQSFLFLCKEIVKTSILPNKLYLNVRCLFAQVIKMKYYFEIC
jgi:hypothetical protein